MERTGVGWLSAVILSLVVFISVSIGASDRAIGASSALVPAGVPRSLAPEQVRGLQKGEEMGLARSAELNGYPNPARVLEAARTGKIDLFADQREAIERVRAAAEAKAQDLGRQILAQEASLEAGFRIGRVADAELSQRVQEIAGGLAELRLTHLRAHLLTAALLRPEQIEEYYQFRGDFAPSPGRVLGY